MLAKDTNGFAGRRVRHEPSLFQNYGPVTESAHLVGIVRDQQNSATIGLKLTNTVHALGLETLVTHGEHFVHDEHIGIRGHGYGKAESDVHTRGEKLDGRVDELLELGELHDLVNQAVDLASRETEHRGGEVDVVATR